ncbi:pyruvate kinase, partial [Pectobacterium brasiliense]|uniref:pyruvate kinase n=1 Tax=Pectobacterium brasiliense TaxID=180957 RepID=UPI001F087EA1
DIDKADIITAALFGVVFLAVSFPRNGVDLIYERLLARVAGCESKIVSNVVRADEVFSDASMDDIILSCDVVLVARGDLCVEI